MHTSSIPSTKRRNVCANCLHSISSAMHFHFTSHLKNYSTKYWPFNSSFRRCCFSEGAHCGSGIMLIYGMLQQNIFFLHRFLVYFVNVVFGAVFDFHFGQFYAEQMMLQQMCTHLPVATKKSFNLDFLER